MKHRHILLVDDDADDQEFFRDALELIPAPLSCDIAVNGKDALEKLAKNEHFPDLIFLDWNMPIMNGQQFLEELCRQPILRAIPVIIISTSSHDQTRQTAERLGVRQFITKPNSFKGLVDAVAAVLL